MDPAIVDLLILFVEDPTRQNHTCQDARLEGTFHGITGRIVSKLPAACLDEGLGVLDPYLSHLAQFRLVQCGISLILL